MLQFSYYDLYYWLLIKPEKMQINYSLFHSNFPGIELKGNETRVKEKFEMIRSFLFIEIHKDINNLIRIISN